MSTPPATTASSIVANTAFASHVLKIDGYSGTKGLATGVHLRSCSFFVGGCSWHIAYLPNGDCLEWADSISLFLVLDDAPARPVLAQFTMSLLDRTGKPLLNHARIYPMTQFAGAGASWGFSHFINRETLEKSRYLKDDCFSIRCDITVITEFRAEDEVTVATGGAPAFVAVPPSDLPHHFGELLATEQGADMRFHVDGVDFPAHRCVLAVRSPVFKAELFGAMMEGSEAHPVEIDDMRADVFRNLLHFIYTDMLPKPAEPKPGCEEEALMAQHLLVAADRYGMERLKIICQDTLCRHIDVSTLATTLALAEQHRCQGLKDACIEFLKSPGALNAVMGTDDFNHLTISCPCLIKELVSKLAAR